jgi:hypothetical protein
LLDGGFVATRVFPFDTPDVWEFARRWISSLYFPRERPSEERLNERTRSLYRALLYHHIVGELTGTPLLVLAACSIVHDDRILPQTLAASCERLWSVLVNLRSCLGEDALGREFPVSGAELQAWLQALAKRMRSRPGTVSHEGAVHLLEQRLLWRYSHDARRSARQAVEDLVRASILVPAEDSRLSFCHESFQDWFRELR